MDLNVYPPGGSQVFHRFPLYRVGYARDVSQGDGPFILIKEWQKMLTDGTRTAVVDDQDHRSRRDFGVALQEVDQLVGGNRLKTQRLCMFHDFAKVFGSD